MGVMTAEITVAANPSEFVKALRSSLNESYISGELRNSRFLKDADNGNRIHIDLQWKDLSTARANYDSVMNFLSEGSENGEVTQIDSELKLSSNVS